jgi:hypothetical protein
MKKTEKKTETKQVNKHLFISLVEFFVEVYGQSEEREEFGYHCMALFQHN